MTTVNKENIKQALENLGIENGDIILVHSSMKSMGYVEGGAETVINAFLEKLGEEGTLCMPTLVQRDFKNAYKNWDINNSPSDVGYLTEYFRTKVNSLRSDQATHAVSAYGKQANYITSEHTAYGPRIGPFGDYAFSHSSPWQRLYELNAKMIFIGVPMRKGTIRHLAEHIIAEKILKNHPEAEPLVRKFSEPLDKLWPAIDGDKMQVVFEKKGILSKTKLGDADVLCADAKLFVEEMILIATASPEEFMSETVLADKLYIDWVKEIVE